MSYRFTRDDETQWLCFERKDYRGVWYVLYCAPDMIDVFQHANVYMRWYSRKAL